MWKSWLLETKLCACVALDHHIMRNKSVSIKTQIFLSQAKEVPGTTFQVNTAYNFKPWKVLSTWSDYYWNFYCYLIRMLKKIFVKTMQKSAFLEWIGRVKGPGQSSLCELWKSLNAKIFLLVETMVPHPECTGFVINLPIWATQGWRHLKI